MAPLVERAALILLDLPQSALAGIDILSFTTTPKFQGVKNLPPGWHFCFTSANSSLSIRHGVWFSVPREKADGDLLSMHVKRWDAAAEELVDVTEEEEIRRHRATLGLLWRDRLTPYRQSVHQTNGNATDQKKTGELEDGSDRDTDFSRLTDRIRKEGLSRICGDCPEHWTLTTASSAKRDLDNIPGLSDNESKLDKDKELNFLPIDLKRTWRDGATGRERTEAARDRSWALGHLVTDFCSKESGLWDVLGEFQFCFVMTLTLNNYSCLEQWKRILELVLTSFDIITRHEDFFVSFLGTLRLQLEHCQDAEGGLFDLSDDGASLLKEILCKFRRGLQSLADARGSLGAVKAELEELETHLTQEHGWQCGSSYVKHGMVDLEDGERVEMDYGQDDEEEETGEYAPVVVVMGE